MDITITITDDQFAAIVSGLPDNGKPIDTVTAHLQECVQPAIMQFVKLADEKRFASVGLPNLKSIGLDEDQCALVIADDDAERLFGGEFAGRSGRFGGAEGMIVHAHHYATRRRGVTRSRR
jgi:hypothetical protein